MKRMKMTKTMIPLIVSRVSFDPPQGIQEQMDRFLKRKSD